MNESKIRKEVWLSLRDIHRLTKPINQKQQVNYLNIAKKVDGLIRDPQTMRYWRQKATSALNRSEIQRLEDLEHLFRDRDLSMDTDIEILYALLAYGHDDLLRINYIIPDFEKVCYPHPRSLQTMYHRAENSLDIYLAYVERDLAAQQDLQRQQPKEAEQPDSGKADLPNEKPEEKEQGATPAKEEKGNVNVNIFGDVQARNLQIAHDASIREQPVTDEKKKGIIKRIPYWIYILIAFLAALLTSLHYLGLLEPIKRLFTR